MRIEPISGKEERRVCMGMIVSTRALARIAERWHENKLGNADMFASQWANTVGSLCVRYFKQYARAPRKAIESLFESYAARSNDKDTTDLIERFLGSLSDEYEQLGKEFNSAYIVDLAANHFNSVRINRLVERVQGSIDSGEVATAQELLTSYAKLDLEPSAGIDVLHDDEALERAFAEHGEPIMEMPGGLGHFIGPALKREGWVCLLGPEKVGKTTHLVNFSWYAMLQRLKVGFFAIGDESEEEMMLRFACRATRTPLTMPEEPLKIPIEMRRDEKRGLHIRRELVEFKHALTFKHARQSFREVCEYKLHSKQEYLRLSVHASAGISVRGIDAQLGEWEQEDFVPDVLVCDYMDNLEESGGPRDDFRQRTNMTWRDFRGLLQRRHLLGFAATQANAASYDGDLITRKNFSEDKRKLAHVTDMIGINVKDDEKARGLCRLNHVVGRGFKYNTLRCCYCAGAAEVQNPAIRSLF